jgi:glycosyltransferase involved in cell wall biosynthesis
VTRIGVVGNLAGVGYELTRALAGIGVPAKLVMPRDRLDQWHRVVTDRAPEDDSHLHLVPAGPHVTPWVIRALRQYDAIVSVCLAGSPVLPHIGRPYVSYATGSDLRELAVGAPIYPRWQASMARHTFRHAELVLHTPDNGELTAIRALRLERTAACRQFVDLEYWRRTPPLAAIDQELVVLSPAQLGWRAHYPGQPLLKRNDILFAGFSRYISSGGRGRLVIIRRGPDADELDALLEHLRLTEHVEIIEGSVGRDGLRDLVARAHVVGDQFSPEGGLGLIALEAMAAGRPVLVSDAEPAITLAYRDDRPPAQWASDADEVAARLHALALPGALESAGSAAASWALRAHEPRQLAAWYRDTILGAVDA